MQNHLAERSQKELRPRGVSELLNEAFALYGRHFWRYAAISAICLVPVAVAQSLLTSVFGWGTLVAAVSALIGILALVYALGATAVAVGQGYANRRIDIGQCYRRVWWRAISLSLLGLLYWSMLVGLFGALYLVDRLGGSALAVPATIGAGALLVPTFLVVGTHMLAAVQVGAIEGRRLGGALQRSYTLVSGRGLKVFGVTMLLALAAFGLGLVLVIPLAAGMALAGVQPEAVGQMLAADLIASAINVAVIPPVVMIGQSLIYYDLRIRKENLDYTKLSREVP